MPSPGGCTGSPAGEGDDSVVSFPGGLRLMGDMQMSPEQYGKWPFICPGGLCPFLSPQVPTGGRHQARREPLGLRRGFGACGLVECGAWRLKSPRGPAWPQARRASSGGGGSVRLLQVLSGSVRFY